MNVKLAIPVYVEEGELFVLRPLFLPSGLVTSEPKLSKATSSIVRKIRDYVRRLARAGDHESISRLAFNPSFVEQRIKFNCLLRRESANLNLLVVTFRSCNRRIAFCPSIPELWFAVERGEKVRERTIAATTEYLRNKERKDGSCEMSSYDTPKRAWTTYVEIEMELPEPKKEEPKHPMAFFGGKSEVSGAEELERVGRCLNLLYPEELSRAFEREKELKELERLLRAHDRRPILLLGKGGCGKSALVHETVYRKMVSLNGKYPAKELTWLLTPGRLIAGMSYVGQWEQRLIAILGEARKKRHILYFDDPVGLFHAGVSAQSNLAVVNILKTYIERREISVIAEATQGAWQVMQELDRGFCDLFHILPVNETNVDETNKILIRAMRMAEKRFKSIFYPDVIPTVVDLQRRYARHQAFPGKGVSFLNAVAAKYGKATLRRNEVLETFHSRSGLAPLFTDEQQSLSRHQIEDELRGRVIGQEEAIKAATDVIMLAKARLNSSEKPLAVFLFVGPTGVGKTHCARAIARVLFGFGNKEGIEEGERFVRFDMNQFVDYGSVRRLVGDLFTPAGLLTSAVRRNPFCVLLFDEIEKAHPEVFDMLLQLLGEGRLTDARGQTVDFTNCIVIMTSNLGVRESLSSMGFVRNERDRASVFRKSVENYFRPEFFNRLDKVVAFTNLERDELKRVAQLQIKEIFHREGLLRRRCLLDVHPQALESAVDQGYDSRLGARALKRSIERNLTYPVSEQIVSLSQDVPTYVRLLPGENGVTVQVIPLQEVKRIQLPTEQIDFEKKEIISSALNSFIERIELHLSELAPDDIVDSQSISAEQIRYFDGQERLRGLRNESEWLVRQLERPTVVRLSGGQPIPARKKLKYSLTDEVPKSVLRQVLAANDVQEFVSELADQSRKAKDITDDRVIGLLNKASILELTTKAEQEEGLFLVKALGSVSTTEEEGEVAASSFALSLANSYKDLFTEMGWQCKRLNKEKEGLIAFYVSGRGARNLLSFEKGTHLVWLSSKRFGLVIVDVVSVENEEHGLSILEEREKNSRLWLYDLVAGQSKVEEDPFPLGPIVRVYVEKGRTIDMATGLSLTTTLPSPKELETLLLTRLPLPEELRDALREKYVEAPNEH